jgi:hypothetical protein
MNRVRYILALTLVGALGLTGCYPEQEQDELAGLRLPLSELGLELSEQALSNWITWLGDPVGAPFDMGLEGNDFSMGLSLVSSDGLVGFSGGQIIYDGELDELLVSLLISECNQCWFDVVIFWRDVQVDPPVVLTFVGDNSDTPFDVIGASGPWGAEVDVWIERVGEVRVHPGVGTPQNGARVAARDLLENVRLPAINLLPGQDPAAVLADLPFGRDLAIEYDPIGDDRFYSIVDTVQLNSGQRSASITLP